MKLFSRFVLIVAMLTLSACGGGSGGNGAGTNVFDGSGGGTAPTTKTASDITLSLSAPTILNTGTATVTATVIAVDANRNTVSGIPVTLAVDNDATVSVLLGTTDASGAVKGTIGIGANRGNRVITVKAMSGSLTPKTAPLQVIGTKITSAALPAVVLPGATAKIQYKVVDSNSAPIPAQDMTITGPGGVQSSGKTDVNGAFEYSYTAPTAVGNLDIRAASGGVETVTTVLVQTVGTLPAVPANSIRSASVRANPSVVSINASGTSNNSAEIRALFVGDSNQPIKNVRVRFDLNGDVNSIGGTFTTGNSLIYSDANGIALSTYVPGSRFSPTDGLTVRACWDYNDFPAGTCPNSSPSATTTTLTVIADPLSVTIGTDGLIGIDLPLVYYQRFVVQVNDSSGLAKANVTISPLLDIESYSKGQWVLLGTKWDQHFTTTACANEDLNRNGVLEIYSNGQAEDQNGNGQLDPRKADAVISFENGNTTDNAGRMIMRVTYPQNIGSWDQFKLTVAASGVAGTEGRASYSSTLPVPISAVTSPGEPAFRVSPYGIEASPTVLVGLPGAPASTKVAVCTNPK